MQQLTVEEFLYKVNEKREDYDNRWAYPVLIIYDDQNHDNRVVELLCRNCPNTVVVSSNQVDEVPEDATVIYTLKDWRSDIISCDSPAQRRIVSLDTTETWIPDIIVGPDGFVFVDQYGVVYEVN